MTPIKKAKAKILRFTPGGIAVKVGEENGFIKSWEIDWEERYPNFTRLYRHGQLIDVAILGKDTAKNELILSIRYANHDPWPKLAEKYNAYIAKKEPFITTGIIQETMHSNAYVIFDRYYTAFISKADLEYLDNYRDLPLSEIFSVGDCVKGIIKTLNNKKRMAEFSIYSYLTHLRSSIESKKSESTIGEILGDKLEYLLKRIYQDNEPATPAESRFLPDNLQIDHLEKIKILFVEDDAQEIAAFKQTFSNLKINYRVIDFSQENEGDNHLLELKQELGVLDNYSCIIIDKNLTNKGQVENGVTIATEILDRKPDFPVILITAEDPYEAMSKLEKAAIHDKAYLIIKTTWQRNLEKMISALEWASLDFFERRELLKIRARKTAFTSSRADLPEAGLIRELLHRICREGQRRAVLLEMNPISLELIPIFTEKMGEVDWGEEKSTLRHSPIFEVIYHQDAKMFQHIPPARKKHFPSEVKGAVSMIGVPMQVLGGGHYGLFLFEMLIPLTFQDFQKTVTIADEIKSLLAWMRFNQEMVNYLRFTTMGILYASMRHDIVSVINSLGKVELVEKWDGLKEVYNQSDSVAGKAKTEFRRKLSAVDHAVKEVLRLFEFFNMLAQGGEEAAWVDLKTVLEQAMKEVEATDVGVNINFTFTDNDTSRGHPIRIRATKTSLMQVFRNVLVNACQQIKGGGLPVKMVSIEMGYEPGDVSYPIKVIIRDTGPGIHCKDFENIFSPLYTTRKGGMGLGSTICREFLKAMGGKIQVLRSFILGGTEFLIEFSEEAP